MGRRSSAPSIEGAAEVWKFKLRSAGSMECVHVFVCVCVKALRHLHLTCSEDYFCVGVRASGVRLPLYFCRTSRARLGLNHYSCSWTPKRVLEDLEMGTNGVDVRWQDHCCIGLGCPRVDEKHGKQFTVF